jgi:predicted transcriptional regulator
MQTISLKLPDDLLARIEKEAKARGIAKSLLVRDSVERALRQTASGTSSCYELARDLAGSMKRMPKDLVDNPKYMDGFDE